MTLSVEDVLQFDAMAGATLIAGAGGLDRPVRSATVLDAPDGAAWLQGDELAFTSTYPLVGLVDRLDGFVQSLAERGVSGLGVKLNRYITEIPPEVIALADRLAFPIISLPHDVSWIELINPIVTSVMRHEANRLRRSQSIHGGFTETLIARSRLEDLAGLLAGMVENPVAIDCPGEGITAWSAPPPDGATEAALLARLRAAEATCIDADHQLFRVETEGGALIYVPLAASLAGEGRIAVLEAGRRFDGNDLDCLLHARNAASIKILEMQAELAVRRSRESDFLLSLLDAETSPAMRDKLIRSGTEAGHALPAPHVLVACEFRGVAPRHLPAIAKRMQMVLAAEPVLSGFAERHIAVLVFNGDLAEEAPDRVIGALFADLRARHPQLRLRAGVSRRLASLTELAEGYAQVGQVLAHDTENDAPLLVLRFEDVGLLRLFATEGVRGEAQRFVSDILGPLLRHDARRKADLITTLRVFLQANGNHRLAAERLNLHHNTVRYRIDKIRKLTGCDVTARNLRLQYELALVLLPVIGKAP